MGDTKVTVEDMRRLLGKKTEPEVEVAKAKIDDDGNITVYDSTIKELSKQVAEGARTELKPVIVETIVKATGKEANAIESKIRTELAAQRTDLFKLAESTRVIEVKTELKQKKLGGVHHENFELLLKIVAAGQPVLMVGPAGTGKTAGAAAAANALDLSFYSISVGSQTSKSDLVGYMHAGGDYVPTQFRHAYEDGGVFLLDEADAGNSNVLILLNAALSNGYMAFPDKMVQAHKDFRMIATANTFGHGANRQYVGRNQLDAATLDRFTVLTWDIDPKVENAMAGTGKDGKRWLEVVRAVRKRVVDELELRVVVSPRATLRGAQLLEAGLDFEAVLQVALVGNMPVSEKKGLENLARTAWKK